MTAGLQVPGASYGCSITAGAPWRLRMPAPVQQMVAQQRWLFLLCGSQVLRVEVATSQVQQVEWPLGCLDGMGWEGGAGARDGAIWDARVAL